MTRRLLKQDYEKYCTDLANYLLGKIIVKKLENGICLKGRIVETESYLGLEDKASHSYRGKITKRNESMFMPAGTAYTYVLYYGYHCFNISSVEPGAVVLIRAVEPISGLQNMKTFRGSRLKEEEICNGPSKLCMAFNITKENSDMLDLTDLSSDIWIDDDGCKEFYTVNSTRIGIGHSAEEWLLKPLRYYIYQNRCVSKRDKKAENEQYGQQIFDFNQIHH
nr:unnamed protein product [Callosobruchus analis]